MDRPRILLADDHAEFAALVARLVESEFEVLQTFTEGQAIVDGARIIDPKGTDAENRCQYLPTRRLMRAAADVPH